MTNNASNLKKNNKIIFKKQAGQILIIFLLLLVVGLALVLSVASRSITDIRTTTISDESSRAYFAAEAGVEEALKRLENEPGYTGGELDFTQINQTTANVNVGGSSTSPFGQAFLFPDQYAQDSVVQVSLLDEFDTLASGVSDEVGNELVVYWGNGNGVAPGIEVSIIHKNPGGTWGIKKFAYDPPGLRANNFCNPDIGGLWTNIATQDGPADFEYRASVPFMDGYPAACPGGGPAILNGVLDDGAAHYPVLARIRLLYNSEPQPVAVGTAGPTDWALPQQGSVIESTGSTISGVTRKLKVTQLFPSLPSIFDYVLFSGTNLTK